MALSCGSNHKAQTINSEIIYQAQTELAIMVIFGKTSRGYFACMPDFNVGCHLVQLCDIFWNTEKLTKVLGKVDGITVATALVALADDLHYPEF